MSQKATRWHYRAIKRKICAGICFSPRRWRRNYEQPALAVRGDRCFRAASNTATVPSVDGLTWLTLINISKISDESSSGGRGERIPLHPTFVSVIFLLMHCFFLFLFFPSIRPLFIGVCARACVGFVGVCGTLVCCPLGVWV